MVKHRSVLDCRVQTLHCSNIIRSGGAVKRGVTSSINLFLARAILAAARSEKKLRHAHARTHARLHEHSGFDFLHKLSFLIRLRNPSPTMLREGRMSMNFKRYAECKFMKKLGKQRATLKLLSFRN